MVRRQQAADRAVRPAMRSPGTPPTPREVQRLFWLEIAKGLIPAQAAAVAGASQPVGQRCFHNAGGMPPFGLEPLSARYLSFAEREEIAILRAQSVGMRQIARALGRDPSTISRELRRNAATRGYRSDYPASVAQWKAELAARRPKVAKLVANPRLHAYVQDKLSGQINGPDGTTVGGHLHRPGSRLTTSRTILTGPGPTHGARSKSPTASRSTSPMMSPCASRTRRSTSPSTSRDGAR